MALQMVRHQNVGGIVKILACRRVEHEFAEGGMKGGCQPAASASLQRIRPEDHRVGLVMMPLQSGKVPFPLETHAVCIEFIRNRAKSVATETFLAANVRRRSRSGHVAFRLLRRRLRDSSLTSMVQMADVGGEAAKTRLIPLAKFIVEDIERLSKRVVVRFHARARPNIRPTQSN